MRRWAVGGWGWAVERGSVRSEQSRHDSHLVAGSQCPCYLLHDSPPPSPISINPRHKAGKLEKRGRGGWETREGRREIPGKGHTDAEETRKNKPEHKRP